MKKNHGNTVSNQYCYDTPIGILCIEEEAGSIVGVNTVASKRQGKETDLLRQTYVELMEYFAGERREFDIHVQLYGTQFQEKVWNVLKTIPYGETRSYKDIARLTGNEKASRAVGGANHKNPVMILIPCHRVIGAKGAMTGFGAGIAVKEYLLNLENNVVRKER